MSEEVRKKPTFVDRLTGEGVLGALITMLSILTALVAYQSAITDSQANDTETEALTLLIDSNTEYLFALQDIMYDYQLYDQWFVEEDVERADYYFSQFTIPLQESYDREAGPFDEMYYEALYTTADEMYTDSIQEFQTANALGGLADQFQLIMLTFAVGLSFAGWASLVDKGSKTRLMFAIFSLVMLVIGLGLYLIVNA